MRTIYLSREYQNIRLLSDYTLSQILVFRDQWDTVRASQPYRLQYRQWDRLGSDMLNS